MTAAGAPPDLSALYRQAVMEAVRTPRFRIEDLSGFSAVKTLKNALCGDVITAALTLDTHDHTLRAAWNGEGCFICQAAAELGATEMNGKTGAEAEKIIYNAFGFFDKNTEIHYMRPFSELKTISGRIKCVKLYWRAVSAALTDLNTEPHRDR